MTRVDRPAINADSAVECGCASTPFDPLFVAVVMVAAQRLQRAQRECVDVAAMRLDVIDHGRGGYPAYFCAVRAQRRDQ